MIAMANAPGSSSSMWSNDGATGAGRPDGTSAISATPCSSRFANATSRMPPATATSGAGTCGATRVQPEQDDERDGREHDRRAADVVEVRRRRRACRRRSCRRRVAGDPEQLRQLARGDREPDADLDPVSVASEMLSMSAPSRSSARRAGSRRPAASASPGRPSGSSLPAATPAATSVEPVSTAIVEVVLTDSVRDPPSSAYTDHRHHAGVEPDLDRQVGDGRVRHRLGDHDGAGGEPGRRGPSTSHARS